MIRDFHLADFFTLGNAACGAAAVFCAIVYSGTGSMGHFLAAFGLVLAALLLDVLDGRVARWREDQSVLGRELDSLSDVISFGVAPAAMAFALGMRGALDWLVLMYFVCCGVSRLARYNVTAETLSGDEGKVKYFEGTPIPTSVVLAAVLAYAALEDRVGRNLWGGVWEIGPWEMHPLVLMFALSGTLMISKTLRIPKF
jgi:CDP-diacylglycerol--serine O-phosphatidyltransferase